MGRKSDYVKRGPNVFLTRIDEAAFTRAILEAFPDVEFFEQYWDGQEHVERPLEALHLAKSLQVHVCVPRPDWTIDTPVWDPASGYWKFGPVVSVTVWRSI